MSVVNNSKEYGWLRNLRDIISLGVLVSYVAGFIAWNFFLSSYNFFEFNFFQTRFLSAGLLFLILLGLTFIVFYILEKLVSLRFPLMPIYKKCRPYFIFTLVLMFYIAFLVYIFPNVPLHFGGGRPLVAAIISTPENIEYLKNLDITVAENAGKPEVETIPTCIIYQNNNFTIVGIVDDLENQSRFRVMTLKNDLITGLNQRPRFPEAEKKVCERFRNWKFQLYKIPL